jgi:hypothetical protein
MNFGVVETSGFPPTWSADKTSFFVSKPEYPFSTEIDADLFCEHMNRHYSGEYEVKKGPK